ncbi:DUF983 domain-containing protein [Algoriphagus lutimaris]|uniref:DUF983 domain-containing protein n=1 Tax=Algoriphagus lutimaris TaxID=613197 RepID=UPI00196A251C|nr:DUF983 domain-containing protein [Algoriphagus lutimaris]MBN3519147.1 DUF983 domain-containing protein [Algoriphagus lutimaris]
MSNKSGFQAMLGAKCPQCRTGNIFPVSPFSFRKLSAIHNTCPHCQANLNPEPDFYYGAMYISYAFSVALVITALTAINVLVEEPELWMYLATVVVGNLLLFPAMLRYSKVLYLYGLGKLKYKGD